MALERADALEAFFPEVLADEVLRDALALQQLLMHPHHQHLLIMGAVEDADIAARREIPRRPPEEIMIKLARARRLERMHQAALRIEAGHDVLDHAVLASRIHRLQHDQESPTIVGVEPFLQRREPIEICGEHSLGLVLVEIEATGVAAIERRQREMIRVVDAEPPDQLFKFHSRLHAWQRNEITNDGIAGSRSAGPRTMRMSESSGRFSLAM